MTPHPTLDRLLLAVFVAADVWMLRRLWRAVRFR